jgi:hypothetical protein
MLEIVPDIAQSTHGNRNIFADIRNVPTRPHTVLGMFLLAFSVSGVSRRSDALSSPSNDTSRSTNPSPLARSTESPQLTTHVGKWRVLRVVHHRGKVTHRTKLQFRVQWEPNDGTVSPDTWLPWNQARRLNATALYVKTIPLLHYLIPLLPAEPTSFPQTANNSVPPAQMGNPSVTRIIPPRTIKPCDISLSRPNPIWVL